MVVAILEVFISHTCCRTNWVVGLVIFVSSSGSNAVNYVRIRSCHKSMTYQGSLSVTLHESILVLYSEGRRGGEGGT